MIVNDREKMGVTVMNVIYMIFIVIIAVSFITGLLVTFIEKKDISVIEKNNNQIEILDEFIDDGDKKSSNYSVMDDEII